MAFIPVPRGASLCFFFGTAGSNWQFCLTLQKAAGDVSESDLEDLTDIGKTWWEATSGPYTMQGPDSSMSKVVATDISEEGGVQHIRTSTKVGGGGTDTLPNNAAVVVSLRTPFRGRSYRGRAYMGGLANTTLETATTISSAFATQLLGYFDDLMTTIHAYGYDVAVASKQHNGAVTNPAVVNLVTDLVVDTLFDSQRRRLYGRGT